VRVLAVEQYGAGPFGTLHLADLGADVIKIEDPGAGGDVGRYVPPHQHGEDSLFFEAFNRNKRSVSLDLGRPAGRAVFEDLVRHSDAVYSNLRGDVPARIGITYDALGHLNPAIVCCSLTGFGMTGPRAAQPGYDYILQGLAGWMDLTGEPGGPPAKSGLSLVDYSGGFVAALALLAGLHAARRDGRGLDCDVSLYDTALSMLTYPGVGHLNAGFTPTRTRHSAHPSLVPFQAFRASDAWIVVGCAKEKFWRRLAHLLDHPEWAEEKHSYGSFEGRRIHRGELVPELEALFAGRSAATWIRELTEAGVPCGPVNSVAEALADPHTAARGLVAETSHPHFGTVQNLISPVRTGPPAPTHRRAPRRGEHTALVLTEILGYDERHIAGLRTEGAFGD
jgi:crotonobetainyl-CoA:carnitine CoA-transferase CaiB-like acyl-CoA transferase